MHSSVVVSYDHPMAPTLTHCSADLLGLLRDRLRHRSLRQRPRGRLRPQMDRVEDLAGNGGGQAGDGVMGSS